MDVKFLIAGDRAVSVEFGSVISLEVNARVRALDEKLKESPIEGMVETVPTLCTDRTLPPGGDPLFQTGGRTGEENCRYA